MREGLYQVEARRCLWALWVPLLVANLAIAQGEDVVTNLTQSAEGDWATGWAPLGDRLAFLSDADGGVNVYVMNADGSDRTTLRDYLNRWCRA